MVAWVLLGCVVLRGLIVNSVGVRYSFVFVMGFVILDDLCFVVIVFCWFTLDGGLRLDLGGLDGLILLLGTLGFGCGCGVDCLGGAS